MKHRTDLIVMEHDDGRLEIFGSAQAVTPSVPALHDENKDIKITYSRNGQFSIRLIKGDFKPGERATITKDQTRKTWYIKEDRSGKRLRKQSTNNVLLLMNKDNRDIVNEFLGLKEGQHAFARLVEGKPGYVAFNLNGVNINDTPRRNRR